MPEKTIGLNDFAISCEDGVGGTNVVEENITQDRAIELLQSCEKFHLEVYVDGFWKMII